MCAALCGKRGAVPVGPGCEADTCRPEAADNAATDASTRRIVVDYFGTSLSAPEKKGPGVRGSSRMYLRRKLRQYSGGKVSISIIEKL